MKIEEVHLIMAYVDSLIRAQIAFSNSYEERDWQIKRQAVEDHRRALIERLKEL